MGKLDKLLKAGGSNISESMGAGVDRGDATVLTSTTPLRWQGVSKSKNAIEVAVARIAPDPNQPREEFEPESLERLAESLKSRGQLQPIRVRWDETQRQYVLISGERRWRAARLAGLATISCVVSEGPLGAGDLLALQLIENCLREDLKPIEQARAFKALMDLNGWSGNQAAKALGIAQPTVVRALALLALPAPVREQVEQGTLAPATAYEIGKVEDREVQKALADQVVKQRLNRSQTIEAVRTASRRAFRNEKGRGALARKKLVTTRTLKAAGCKITIENRRGIDDSLVITALQEALAQVESRRADVA